MLVIIDHQAICIPTLDLKNIYFLPKTYIRTKQPCFSDFRFPLKNGPSSFPRAIISRKKGSVPMRDGDPRKS